MSQDYGKNWEASLVHDLFISIQLVRIFSSMLQQGEVKLEKSVITLNTLLTRKGYKALCPKSPGAGVSPSSCIE